ncbi:hypothetical protein HELRODRAFT_165647 [Helobdella robusta]|uniref:Uncharacterized protein n=1 Tax=Helobdella robusta TaxID=6412 RepID=T1EX44_HELRO|nr:hypothetical protein HELRODRAFT_165647 [Helobdella robusta]ESN91594.1 hypothetical protein HELRODRAFT_165647 [Helobdella robusta]
MAKRKSVYREQFSTDFPGIKKSKKGENYAFCEYCSTDVSIANAGVSSIKQHFEKEVHKNNVKIKKSTVGISTFFHSNNLPTSRKTAAAEGAFAYHVAFHSLSFKAADCTNRFISTVFAESETGRKFSSAQTKTQAIISRILAPKSIENLLSELGSEPFSIATDSSNFKEIKTFPIIIRYFSHEGLKVKLLEFSNLPGETMQKNFFGAMTQSKLQSLEDSNLANRIEKEFSTFYSTSVDYIQKWFRITDYPSSSKWLMLKSVDTISYEDIRKSAELKRKEWRLKKAETRKIKKRLQNMQTPPQTPSTSGKHLTISEQSERGQKNVEKSQKACKINSKTCLRFTASKSFERQFCAEYIENIISYPMFTRLRPFWVRMPTSKDRETCLCKKHDNVQLKADKLYQLKTCHFGASNQQATIHTGVLYKYNGLISFASISESLRKDPSAIWAHIEPILQNLRESYPGITTLHFFSDGPTTQYRNKQNFYLLSTQIYKLGFTDASWNFFEAGHGKGAPDAIGGALKRRADDKVNMGCDITTAQSLFKVMSESDSQIKLYYIEGSDIGRITSYCHQSLTAIAGTMKVHQLYTDTELCISSRHSDKEISSYYKLGEIK